MKIFLLSILLGSIIVMLVKRKQWFESVGFLRWWPNTWQGYAILGLFILSGAASVYLFEVKEKEREVIRVSDKLQSSISVLQEEHLLYFRNDLKCRKLHYLDADGRGKLLFAEPLDSICGNPEHEILFTQEAQEKFDTISQLVAEEGMSKIQTTWSFGKISAAAFYKECENVCNPIGYVFNPEGATFPLDKPYLDLVSGEWYSIGYHPSPF